MKDGAASEKKSNKKSNKKKKWYKFKKTFDKKNKRKTTGPFDLGHYTELAGYTAQVRLDA